MNTTTETTILKTLQAQPLSKDAFRPFGDVIETGGAQVMDINWGMTQRFHDLAHVDVATDAGVPLINIFRSRPVQAGFKIAMVERHPLGSQAFIPLASVWFYVVVANAVEHPTVDDLHLFIAGPGQGVNYSRGTWHHPLLAIGRDAVRQENGDFVPNFQDFLVVDRGGAGHNLEEYSLSEAALLPDLDLHSFQG